MAISYVGGVEGGRAGSTSTTTQSLSGTLTGGSDTSPSTGDLVVVFCASGGDGTGSPTSQTISGNNSGAYNALTFQSTSATTYDSFSQVNYFIQGTVDTSLTIPSSGNARNAQRWIVHVFRGVDASTPLDVTSTYATGTATGRPNPALIAPTTAGAWICAFYASAAATGAAYTAPTDFATDWLGGTTADTADVMTGGGYYTGWTSGNYDPAAITAGGTTNAADSWTATTIALRPTPPTFTQAAYRFYEDGTETGSTAVDAQNTNITRDVSGGDSNIQLRLRLQETNGNPGESTDDYQLQYELNDSGVYRNISGLIGGTAIDNYSIENRNSQLILGDTNKRIGQSITGNGSTVVGAAFIMRVLSGTPTNNITATIYAHSGTFGTSSVGTGSVLATSDPIPASDLTTSWNEILFNFTGANQITLTNTTKYVLAVEYNDSTNTLNIGSDTTSPTHGGNAVLYDGGSWAAENTIDIPFGIYSTNPAPAPVINFASASLTDGNATTNRLGSGSGSFVAGEISEDGLVDNLQITASNYTELLYSLTIDADAVADADTLDFRVLRNGATTGMTYTVTPRITIEEGGGTPSPSVSDSITLSESTSLLIPELFINKSESITVTESTTRLLESYISKSESVTITENTDPELVSLINVSENTTISESIEKVLESYINKSDNITLTENTSTLIPELLRSISDSVTLTENTKVELNSDITKSESVTLTENVATDLPITINKSESVMITENPVADLGITVNKSEDIAIIENAVASIVTDTPADYDVNVNDTVTITEALQRLLESYVNKSESVTLTESVTVLITELFLSVSDSATVTENLQRLLESYISKSESLTITEALSLLLESSISVSDSATITENINRLLESYINKSESVTVTESVNNLLENLISVSDNATLTENLKLLQESYINKSENVTLTESVVVYEPTYNLSVSDDITITDSPSVAIQLEGAINTNDTATVSESINLLIPELYLSTNDTATISESTNLELTSRVNVTDTATLTENTRQELNSFINVSDEVTLTENAVVEVQEATTLQIAVSDTTTITESTSFFTNPLLLSKSENITITENRDVSIEGVVNLRKYFIDLDGNVYYVLNQTAGIIEKV